MMSGGERLMLVIPCYNEAARLDRDAFMRALQDMAWLDLCFVNDGSTDDTARVLRELATLSPTRVDVLTLPQNRGKAEAVRQGLQHASERATLCGFWDADLSAPLSELPALRAVFERVSDVDWVFGIRLKALGRHITRGALRHYLGRLFATVASALLNVGAYDTQCGAKLFRVTPLLRTVISAPFLSRWIFDVELLCRADSLLRFAGTGRVLNDLVFEQPLSVWHHQAGSKVKSADFVRALREVLLVREGRKAWARRV